MSNVVCLDQVRQRELALPARYTDWVELARKLDRDVLEGISNPDIALGQPMSSAAFLSPVAPWAGSKEHASLLRGLVRDTLSLGQVQIGPVLEI
jgi:hypothetical protein